MEWDKDKETVKYCVYTSSECWCDVKDLLKWNTIDLVEKHYMDNMEEKDKAKALDMKLKGEDYSGKRFEYIIPDGYEFDKVENGKIILKPIKPKYPKTYLECKKMLPENEYYGFSVFMTLQNLIICRNVYWQIAGEEMGLGKPWESDWENGRDKFGIINCENCIIRGVYVFANTILAFPTEEMRDAFHENFKELIESCKELL